jgi:hypothetical protein
MLQELFLENPLFSLNHSSTIERAIPLTSCEDWHCISSPLLLAIALREELYIRELKIPPKEEEGIHNSLPFSTVLACQYIDPLVAIWLSFSWF